MQYVVALFLSLFALPSVADVLVEGVPPKRAPEIHGSLDLGVSYLSGNTPKERLARRHLYLRMAIVVTPRLFLYGGPGVEVLTLKARYPYSSIPHAQASSSDSWRGTLTLGGGAGIVLTPVHHEIVRVVWFGEGEGTPWKGRLVLDTLDVETNKVRTDATELVAPHVSPQYHWYLVRSGLYVSARLGRATQFISVALFHYDLTISVNPDAALRSVLTSRQVYWGVGLTEVNRDRTTVLSTVGMNADLTRRLGLNWSWIFAPRKDFSWEDFSWGAQSALSYKF